MHHRRLRCWTAVVCNGFSQMTPLHPSNHIAYTLVLTTSNGYLNSRQSPLFPSFIHSSRSYINKICLRTVSIGPHVTGAHETAAPNNNPHLRDTSHRTGGELVDKWQRLLLGGRHLEHPFFKSMKRTVQGVPRERER